MDTGGIFLCLLALLVAGIAGGWIAKRLGQPAILGELAAGAVLGLIYHGGVPFWEHHAEALHILGHIGLCALLFTVGLEIRLRDVISVGRAAAGVAIIGVVIPFVLGYWIASLFGLPALVRLFIAATLTATSVGITAEVMDELGMIKTSASRIILSAAVLDDVLGLIILTMVSGVAYTQSVSVPEILKLLGLIAIFFVITLTVVRRLISVLMNFIEATYGEKGITMISFALLLVFAYLAARIGLDSIVGAFLAGLTLSEVRQQHTIDHGFRPFINVFASLFFILIGTEMDLTLMNPFRPENRAILGLSTSLMVVAIFGKLASGLAIAGDRTNRVVVGIGMIPRGEVGLICGNLGLVCGVLTHAHFSALLLVVMVTTFLGPVLLRSFVPDELKLAPMLPPE